MKLTRTLLLISICGFVLMLAAIVMEEIFYLPWIRNSAISGMLAVIWPYSSIAYLCSYIRDRGKLRLLMILGITLSAAALAGWLGMMWWPGAQHDDNWVWWVWWSGAMTSFAVAIAIIGGVWLVRVRTQAAIILRSVVSALLACCAIYALFIICAGSWYEEYEASRDANDFMELHMRLAGILTILLALGVLTLIALSNPLRAEKEPSSAERLTFRIACPRCGVDQQLVTEGDACTVCGLKIKVIAT